MDARCKGKDHPIEDPSALTTKQLHREIAVLKEIVDVRMHGVDGLIKLLQESVGEIPNKVKAELENLKELHNEKFASVQTQFQERDTRGEQQSKDGKVAVDAALQAAKEAVGEQNKSSAQAIAKSESATTKQIDQIGNNIQNNNENMNGKIDDVKARLFVIEGQGKGLRESKDDGKSNVAIGISIVAAVIMVASLFYQISRPAAPQIIYAQKAAP